MLDEAVASGDETDPESGGDAGEPSSEAGVFDRSVGRLPESASISPRTPIGADSAPTSGGEAAPPFVDTVTTPASTGTTGSTAGFFERVLTGEPLPTGGHAPVCPAETTRLRVRHTGYETASVAPAAVCVARYPAYRRGPF